MKRADVIQRITIAIAQNDTATATRLYIDHRISRDTYNRATARGREIQRKIASGMTAYDAMRTTP